MQHRKKRCLDFARILASSPPTTALREQIVECFHAELRSVARRTCDSDSLADDALQMAFESGLEALGSFRGDAPLSAWLRSIVRSSCSRLRRTRKDDPALHQPLDTIAHDQELDSDADSPDTIVLVAERFRILKGVLDTIPEPNRSLLLVHEIEEVPLTDLAQQFGLTVESVKARLKRTRHEVRERVLVLANEEV